MRDDKIVVLIPFQSQSELTPPLRRSATVVIVGLTLTHRPGPAVRGAPSEPVRLHWADRTPSGEKAVDAATDECGHLRSAS